MKSIFKKIPLYWKCQLIGWGLFSALIHIELALVGGGDRILFITFTIPLFITGILFSHLMRVCFKKLKLVDKPVFKQIIPVLLFNAFFGIFIAVFSFRVLFDVSWQEESAEEIIYTIIDTWVGASLFLFLWSLIYFSYHYILRIKRQEAEKMALKIETIEMEARALRAQMNPHFVFNCLNSIKSLIQQHEEEKSVAYLTTFSKLIRTLFQNCDKRQISLYDEIETCRLYTQLEAMRLGGKLKYSFKINSDLDLKSVMVPALIIQPFIENAIWHGIVPKEEGTLNLTVKRNGESVICEIDDDGIGREMSKLNKPNTPVIHESKGVKLSQTRLDIEKVLNETKASIETIDKHEGNKPSGTRVIITFYLQ